MKQFYTVLISAFIFSSTHLNAQVIDAHKFLDINNMKIPLFSRGDMFRPGINNSHIAQMPKGKLTNTVFTQNMWFGGLDQNNELHLASQLFSENGIGNVEYALGPASDSNTPETISKYNHVWKINKTEIEHHIEYYNTPNYTIPEDILTWPAHGDSEHGEAPYLAPFVDVNSNGVYEPELGDYPKIRGDQALFAMFNDVNPDELNSEGQKVYVEVHVMLYAYSNPYTDFLENSYFVHYDIYNRSNHLTYPEFYIAHFLSFDLGFHYDDYVGTHVSKNIAYVYNGDQLDETTAGSFGYGEKPPVFGWALLNQNYHSTRRIINNFDFKVGNPFTPIARFNTMKGLFNNGTPMLHGAFGEQGSEITKFFYPGTSHPDIPARWDEPTDGNAPGNRLMTASTVSYDFGPGDKICLDYAGVFSRDFTSDTQHQLNHLFADVDGVKSVYNFENFDCADYSLNIQEVNKSLLDVYASNTELIVTRKDNTNTPIRLSIVNTLGQTVLLTNISASESETVIDISGLPSGIYIVPNVDFKFVK